MLRRSSARYVVILYALDMLLTAAALFAARWLRMALSYGRALDVEGAALSWPMVPLALVVWTVVLTALRVYDPQRLADATGELQRAVLAISAATVGLAGALYFSYRGLSRLLYAYFYILDVLLCVAARVLMRRGMAHRRNNHRRGVLILGAGPIGQRIARSLAVAAWMGVEVVGYLDDDPAKAGQTLEGHPVLGPLSAAQGAIQQHEVREVVIALPLDAHQRLAQIVAELQPLPIHLKVAPDYSAMALYRSSFEELGGVFLIGLKEPVIGPVDRIIKRAFDVVVASAALVVLSPLLALIALAVKRSSSGPLLYHSERIGEGGRPFLMLKFRTMYQDADQRERELIVETGDGKLVFDKRRDDPRITPVGHLLRRYSLDELPQLWNVLRGEMSLVGPRPELPALVARYEPWQRQRFSVPQGLTGWWQISGRSNKAKYLHVEDDLYYIRNYSLLLDWHILLRTLSAVIKGEGAF
ncbi:MAG: sugar transferase [Chloroflexota bacterium]